jgi:hypothetical protein
LHRTDVSSESEPGASCCDRHDDSWKKKRDRRSWTEGARSCQVLLRWEEDKVELQADPISLRSDGSKERVQSSRIQRGRRRRGRGGIDYWDSIIAALVPQHATDGAANLRQARGLVWEGMDGVRGLGEDGEEGEEERSHRTRKEVPEGTEEERGRGKRGGLSIGILRREEEGRWAGDGVGGHPFHDRSSTDREGEEADGGEVLTKVEIMRGEGDAWSETDSLQNVDRFVKSEDIAERSGTIDEAERERGRGGDLTSISQSGYRS